MITRIHTRELLTWVVLALSVLLFSITVAFASDKETTKGDEGKIKIKIIKEVNGKTVKIDTTFNTNDEAAMEKFLESLGLNNGAHHSISISSKNKSKGDKHQEMVMKFCYRDSIEKELEKLEDEIENNGNGHHEYMKDLHIDINGPNEDDFDFDFIMPPLPPIPPGAWTDDSFKPGKSNSFGFNWNSSDDWSNEFEGIDSLDDDNHILFYGDEDESAPVFEKEITGTNGKKVFIFRRNNQSEKEDASRPDIYRLKVYPNPGRGIVHVEFNTEAASDLQVQVFDQDGKEVYNENIHEFNGDYSNQINLSGKGKGSYILKITREGKTLSRKIVVN